MSEPCIGRSVAGSANQTLKHVAEFCAATPLGTVVLGDLPDDAADDAGGCRHAAGASVGGIAAGVTEGRMKPARAGRSIPPTELPDRRVASHGPRRVGSPCRGLAEKPRVHRAGPRVELSCVRRSGPQAVRMRVDLALDGFWERAASLLPPVPKRRDPDPGRLRVPDRAAQAAIVYVLRTGVAGRDVPAKAVGCSRVTAWRRLRDWTEAGVWPRLHTTPPPVTLTGDNRHDVTQLLPLLDAIHRYRGLRGRPRRQPPAVVPRSWLRFSTSTAACGGNAVSSR